MKSLSKDVLKIICITLFAASLLVSTQVIAAPMEKYSTYFQYSPAELSTLKKLSSPNKMTVDQLKKWDTIMFNLVKKNKLNGFISARIYTYVYTAQRDAIFLSKNIKTDFMGSLEPISSKVLCLFFPHYYSALQKKTRTDIYSEKLADIILEKIKARMESEKKQNKIYPQTLKGKNYWAGQSPYAGQDAGSTMTWLISSPSDFLPPRPPAPQSIQWQNELKQLKIALKNNTPEQINSIKRWAGTSGSITLAGIWLKIANDYMDAAHTPLEKRVIVRSVLAQAICDALTAAFHAKYTYWVRRPFMLDPNLHSVILTPNHPSYPAGHAVISGSAAAVLTHYFPNARREWWRMANESSQGRVIAGVHFPIDIKQGLILGKKVGNAALTSS